MDQDYSTTCNSYGSYMPSNVILHECQSIHMVDVLWTFISTPLTFLSTDIWPEVPRVD